MNFFSYINDTICSLSKSLDYEIHFAKKGEFTCEKQIEFMVPLFEEFSTKKTLYMKTFKIWDFIFLMKKDVFVGGVFAYEHFDSFAIKEESILEKNENEEKPNLKSETSEKYPVANIKQIIVQCLFVKKEFRLQGLSSVLLNEVNERYKPDIFTLGISPKRKMGAINFYNYFKHNFIYIFPNFSCYSYKKICDLTEEEFLNTKVDSLEKLEKIQKQINSSCNDIEKKKAFQYHIIMSCINFEKNNIFDKETLIKSAEDFLKAMRYSD